MDEVSRVVRSAVAQLADPKDGWPEWNIRAFEPVIRAEDVTKHIEVVVSAPVVLPSTEERGLPGLDVTVTMQADIYWRFVDAATHSEDHPQDIAATILAWTKARYIEGASTVCRPVGVELVLDSTPYIPEEMARLHYQVQWEVDLIVNPQIESRGPEPIPVYRGGDISGVPPVEVHIEETVT